MKDLTEWQLIGIAESHNDELANEAMTESSVYEYVNHPKHYNTGGVEVIDMMQRIWGDEATIIFCHMNAFKYRMRMGDKPSQSLEQEMEKVRWYTNKAIEIINNQKNK